MGRFGHTVLALLTIAAFGMVVWLMFSMFSQDDFASGNGEQLSGVQLSR